MRPTALVALLALVLSGQAAGQDSLVRRGKALYDSGCISCHGRDGAGIDAVGPARGAGGIQGAGPSLRDVGAASADFYLRTGYMPLAEPTDRPHRRDPAYTDRDLRALVAYVASLGGGLRVPPPQPERGRLSEGLALFTEYCSGCHQVVGQGGVVTTAVAPALRRATPLQIAQAVRVGPYVMPRFSRSTISDRELDSIVRYVGLTKDPVDRGGWGIGHVGPVPEGIVAWLVAGAALVLVARLIGRRARP